MEIPAKLRLVEPKLIPKGLDCSGEDLVNLFKLGLLLEEFCEKQKGVGISAVQVGIPFDFFVVKFPDQYRFFLNCTYEPLDESKEKSLEACLSLKTLIGGLRFFEVDRHSKVKIKGKELIHDIELKIVDFEFVPDESFKIVFQHEIDHSQQILISQIGKEVFLWENRN
jgi:peptide deformylase